MLKHIALTRTHALHIAFVSICATLLVFTLIQLTREGSEQASAQPANYQLVWSDEFTGTSLDTSKWTYQTGGWDASGVQNCYRESAVDVSGGSLRLTASYTPAITCAGQTRHFTSGFVQTKDRISWTYGYFEARIRMPASNSTWPAFWMSPQTASYGSWPRSGEIDVVEARGHQQNRIYADAHWGESSSSRRHQQGSAALASTTSWNTYGVVWTEGRLEFYLNGTHYHTVSNFQAPNATTHPGPFNIPFYLRLNMAVGGTYLDAPHNDAFNNLAQLPAVMEVDYVRVYQYTTPSTPDPQPATPPSNPGNSTNTTTPNTSTSPTQSTPSGDQVDQTTPSTNQNLTDNEPQSSEDQTQQSTEGGAEENASTEEHNTTPESAAIQSGDTTSSHTTRILLGGITFGVLVLLGVGLYSIIARRKKRA